MDKRYEIKNQSLEDTYWWFIARRDIMYNLISNLNKNVKILEIGCSGGPLIKFLKRKGFKNIYGLDISERAINLCKKSGLNKVFVMDATKIDFKNEEFDVILTSDVLEHIKNDAVAIAEWNRILKSGGRLIVFVPAFNFLWSPHDETNFHCRRYSKPSLEKLLTKSDFRVIKSSYWNFSLFFPAFFVKFFQRMFTSKKNEIPNQLFRVNETTNNFLKGLLKLENKFIRKHSFPFGISVFAVCEKINK